MLSCVYLVLLVVRRILLSGSSGRCSVGLTCLVWRSSYPIGTGPGLTLRNLHSGLSVVLSVVVLGVL